MKIGYACKLVNTGDYTVKSCIRKNATPEKLGEIITHNLEALDRMLDYNIREGINMFRISSDIIPFGSSPVNTLPWREQFAGELAALGKKARDNGMRLSMHPGQYTVLNSPNENTVAGAVEDLRYHTAFLDALGLGPEHKIILHIGGAYGDKPAALARFLENYKELDGTVKARLIIENDDKLFHIEDVLWASRQGKIPVVFDVFHHQVLGCPSPGSDLDWLRECVKTWGVNDGIPKIHYSQQAEGKKPGSHSETIVAAPFLALYRGLVEEALNVDIMLEVKDKNLSAIKCLNCVSPTIGALEREWARYKYSVLERSPQVYQKIRTLLKEKNTAPVEAFYSLLEQAQQQPVEPGNGANAAQHVWGYYKKIALEGEKAQFSRLLAQYQSGGGKLSTLKRFLWRLTVKYGQPYLLDSLYFIE